MEKTEQLSPSEDTWTTVAIPTSVVCRWTEVGKRKYRKYPEKCMENPPKYWNIVVSFELSASMFAAIYIPANCACCWRLNPKTLTVKKKIILLLFLCPLQDFTSFEVFAANPALAVGDKAMFEVVLDHSGFFLLSASLLFALIQGCQARFVLVTVRCPNIDACKFFWTGLLRHANIHPIIQTNSQ